VQRTGMVSLIRENLTIESCGVTGAPCPMERQGVREGLADRAVRHPNASCRSMASNGGKDKAIMILEPSFEVESDWRRAARIAFRT
jgi:hypothetical protein